MGNTILSISAPLFFNVMTQFCNRWFLDSERTFVTVICGLSIPAGNLCAFVLAGLVFKGVKSDTPIAIVQ